MKKLTLDEFIFYLQKLRVAFGNVKIEKIDIEDVHLKNLGHVVMDDALEMFVFEDHY
ncbi:hypothetical protein GF354_05810 [Candidatus Peregrinibacteria bacterium]|nr:hypothetical protein [Candidatus Peregrinibacteria bacterium]